MRRRARNKIVSGLSRNTAGHRRIWKAVSQVDTLISGKREGIGAAHKRLVNRAAGPAADEQRSVAEEVLIMGGLQHRSIRVAAD